MTNVAAVIGIRDLSTAETEAVSGGLIPEIAFDLTKKFIEAGVVWLYDKGVGWVQSTVTDANQTGVVGQPTYVDPLGNSAGAAIAVPDDNKNSF